MRFAHRAGGALCRGCAALAPGARSLPADARAALVSWSHGAEAAPLDARSTRAHQRLLREFRTDDPSAFSTGQELKVDQFEPGIVVDVVATSIGRGFQGTRKRHGFTGGRATHGCTTHDQPGSIGASAFPSRVIKGKRLPGRMGGKRVTVRNLTVVAVDPEQSLLVVRGAIPGPVRGFVLVRPAKKA